jgi:hypothetical protein
MFRRLALACAALLSVVSAQLTITSPGTNDWWGEYQSTQNPRPRNADDLMYILGFRRLILQFSVCSRVVAEHNLVDLYDFHVLELHHSVRTVSFSPCENSFN